MHKSHAVGFVAPICISNEYLDNFELIEGINVERDSFYFVCDHFENLLAITAKK